jgi:hypothetical protein
MKTITPVTVWYNGSEVPATVLNATVQNDNMQNSATFMYQLMQEISQPNTSYVYTQPVVTGYLTIAGTDYQDWDLASPANEFAYEWIAEQLKLTITGEYVPPAPPAPIPPFPPTTTTSTTEAPITTTTTEA